MKNFVGFTLGCLFAFLSSGITPLMAQDAAVNELVITGTVKNKDSRKKLENVNVSVVGNNIGTVTNADGTFSLKVAEAEAFRGLEVSHIGYLTTHLSMQHIYITDYQRLFILIGTTSVLTNTKNVWTNANHCISWFCIYVLYRLFSALLWNVRYQIQCIG